ncbi:MAG: hypothetical protein HY782_05295 [Chloroflexi bacterium]|nr:hypothetical protein [Chloroflexota bacterium]
MHRVILFAILVVYVVIAALYAIFTPKWQAPDEPAHFNYIRTIGETGTLPVLQEGDYNQDYLEKIKAAKFPASMPIDSIRYESYQPPLYYLSAVPVYLVARAGGIDAAVLALRLYSVALEVIVLLLAFAIVREMFPDDPLLALATVGLMATIPMHIAITASISNDIAAELILALILFLSVLRVKNKISDRRFVILGGILFGAALLTKTTAYATGALLLIGAEIAHQRVANYESHRDASQLRITNYASLLATFSLALLLSAPMFLRNMLTYGLADPLGLARHDAVVIGQPTTAEMIRQYGFSHVLFGFFAVTFKSFWAQFGWMGVLVNDRIYVALFILMAIALFGFGLWAVRIVRHRELLTPLQHWAIGLLGLLTVVALLDYVAYNFKFLQLQGRYLFPAIIPIAFFLVLGIREILAKEHARLTFALLYVMFVGLDIASLFLYIVPQLRP